MVQKSDTPVLILR